MRYLGRGHGGTDARRAAAVGRVPCAAAARPTRPSARQSAWLPHVRFEPARSCVRCRVLPPTERSPRGPLDCPASGSERSPYHGGTREGGVGEERVPRAPCVCAGTRLRGTLVPPRRRGAPPRGSASLGPPARTPRLSESPVRVDALPPARAVSARLTGAVLPGSRLPPGPLPSSRRVTRRRVPRPSVFCPSSRGPDS